MCIIDNGLLVTDDGIIKIDASKWTTQAELTKKLGLRRNIINNRVRRYSQLGTLRTYYIEQLGIRLIPNVSNISELGGD